MVGGSVLQAYCAPACSSPPLLSPVGTSAALLRTRRRSKPARPPPRVRVAFFYSDHRPRPTRRAVRTSRVTSQEEHAAARPAIIAYDALLLSFFFLLSFSLLWSSFSNFTSYSISFSSSLYLSSFFSALLISTGTVPLLHGAQTDRRPVTTGYRYAQRKYAKIVLIRGNIPCTKGENLTLRRCLTPGRHFRNEFRSSPSFFL